MATGRGWGQGGQQPEPALGQEQAGSQKPGITKLDPRADVICSGTRRQIKTSIWLY